jgi:hypothetical protein
MREEHERTAVLAADGAAMAEQQDNAHRLLTVVRSARGGPYRAVSRDGQDDGRIATLARARGDRQMRFTRIT